MNKSRDAISKTLTSNMLAGPSPFLATSNSQKLKSTKQRTSWINETENREEKASSFDNPPSQELDISVTKNRIKRIPSTRRRLSDITNLTNDSRLSKAHFAILPSSSSSDRTVGALDHETPDTVPKESWFTISASPPWPEKDEDSFHSCNSEIDASEGH